MGQAVVEAGHCILTIIWREIVLEILHKTTCTRTLIGWAITVTFPPTTATSKVYDAILTRRGWFSIVGEEACC